MAKEDVIVRIKEVLNEYLQDKDLEIYDVEYKKEGPDWKLRVYLDKPIDSETEYVDIDECVEATRFLSAKLDELDIIDRKYMLEVSSPGLDRELKKDSDFERFAGRIVDVKLYKPMNGQKMIEAELVGKTEENVVKLKYDGEDLEIPKKEISKISLAVIF